MYCFRGARLHRKRQVHLSPAVPTTTDRYISEIDTSDQVESENQEDIDANAPLKQRNRIMRMVGDSGESAGKRRMGSTRKDAEEVPSSPVTGLGYR